MTPPRKWITAAAITAAVLSLGATLDGPSAQDEAEATAASLQDALKQAQAENPKGWTAEQKARGDVAARIVAHTRQEAP